MPQAQEKNVVVAETSEVKDAETKPAELGLEQLDDELLRQIGGAGSGDPTSLPVTGW